MNLQELFSGQVDFWLLVAIVLAAGSLILITIAIVMVFRLQLRERGNRPRR